MPPLGRDDYRRTRRVASGHELRRGPYDNESVLIYTYIYTSAAEVRDRSRAAHGAFYSTILLPGLAYNIHLQASYLS